MGNKRVSKEKPLKLKWADSTIKILGVLFSYDQTDAFNWNYNEKLQNLEKTLNLWKMKDLSVIGRTLITKTLRISKFVFA